MRATALALAVVLAACGYNPPPLPATVGFANGTSLTVTFVVSPPVVGQSAQLVVTVPPQTVNPGVSTTALLPAFPWTVEARAPSGRVLGSAVLQYEGVANRADLALPCGLLTIWTGPDEPAASNAVASLAVPADCAP